MTQLLVVALLGAIGLACASGCRRVEPQNLDPVRALRGSVEPRFRPPEDGLIAESQLDMYLKVRRRAGAGSLGEAARAMGVDPAELVWVRARIVEAMVALDSKRVTDEALASYGRALATLREAKRGTRDPKVTARLDSEIAALERDRAALRRSAGLTPAMLSNGARVARRRSEIESLDP